jgi:hypothetical protein
MYVPTCLDLLLHHRLHRIIDIKYLSTDGVAGNEWMFSMEYLHTSYILTSHDTAITSLACSTANPSCVRLYKVPNILDGEAMPAEPA